MATRTSIELHPDGCRIVEVVVPREPARGAIVRAFTPSVADGRDASTVTEALVRFRQSRRLQRRAYVTIWGLGPRPLRLAAAVMNDVRDHLHPIVHAGFIVERVTTPAHALAALARGRGDEAPGAVTAYVAIEAGASCLALVRDGALLSGRELPRGHAGSVDAINEDLAAALKQMALDAAPAVGSIESAIVCGDDASLPAIAQKLAVTLGVPVDTLDWAAGVDLAASPAVANAPRAEVAAMRLAIAAAVASAPMESLLPPAIRRPPGSRMRLRIAAAIIAGLLVAAGWYMVRVAAGPVRTERLAVPNAPAAPAGGPAHQQTDPR